MGFSPLVEEAGWIERARRPRATGEQLGLGMVNASRRRVVILLALMKQSRRARQRGSEDPRERRRLQPDLRQGRAQRVHCGGAVKKNTERRT